MFRWADNTELVGCQVVVHQILSVIDLQTSSKLFSETVVVRDDRGGVGGSWNSENIGLL